MASVAGGGAPVPPASAPPAAVRAPASGESASVKVALRIRPLSTEEKHTGNHVCIQRGAGGPAGATVDFLNAALGGTAAYAFDDVFDSHADQAAVFTCVQPLLDSFVEGYNATVFAYGQTGSGKTFTMGSGRLLDENSVPIAEDATRGVIPRAAQYLFQRFNEIRAQAAANNVAPPTFQLSCTFLELYNEKFYDLLTTRRTTPLKLVDQGANGAEIQNATVEDVPTPERIFAKLDQGSLNRTTAQTDMNATSSRSHAIFTLVLRQVRPSGPADSAEAPTKLMSRLHFVDLAGSERLARTQATGDRAREGVEINKSLQSLGRVVRALADGNEHKPYRDSVLTRLLQNSLGGNSRTLMIACVSPADRDSSETRSTLDYATNARKIRNTVVVNRDNGTPEVAELKRQIVELRAMVDRLQARGGSDRGMDTMAASARDPRLDELEEDRRRLVEENRQLRERLENGTREAIQDQVTRVLDALGVSEGALEDAGTMSAAAANEFVTTIADLQTRLKDAEDALELERSTPKRRSRRSSSSRTLRSGRAASARMVRDPSGTDGGHENGTAEDAYASDALEASLQTVENDLALSRRMLEDFDPRPSDQEDDVALELQELRLALERAQRDKDNALARVRSAPHEQEEMRQKYEGKIQKLNSQLDDARRRQRDLELQRAKTQTELPALKGSVEALKRQRTEIAQRLQENEEKVKELHSTVRDLHNKLRATVQRSDNLKRDMDKECARLKADIDLWKAKAAKLSQQRDEARAQLDKVKAKQPRPMETTSAAATTGVPRTSGGGASSPQTLQALEAASAGNGTRAAPRPRRSLDDQINDYINERVSTLLLHMRKEELVAQRAKLSLERHQQEQSVADADVLEQRSMQLTLAMSKPALDAVNAQLTALENDVITSRARSDHLAHALTTKLNSLSHQMRRELALGLIQKIIRMRLDAEDRTLPTSTSGAAVKGGIAHLPAAVAGQAGPAPPLQAAVLAAPVPVPVPAAAPVPPEAAATADAPLAARTLIMAHKFPSSEAKVLDVAADAERAVAVDRDGMVRVWDLARTSELFTYQATASKFASVAVDARSIYVAAGAQVVELDDAGRVVRRLQAPHAATTDMAVTSVRVHPNGVHLVATTEAAVLVWDRRTERLLASVPHNAPVRRAAPLAFDPARHALYVGDRSNAIRPIAADTFTALAALQPAHAVDLRCLAAAGNHLYSAGGDPFGASARGFVKRWSLGGGVAAVADPTPLVASDTYFTAMAVREADMCVVAAGKDGMGVVLDGLAPAGTEPRPVRFDRSSAVAALALAGPAQASLVSAANKTVRLWTLSHLHD